MSYVGDTFGGVQVQIEKDGLDLVRIDGHEIMFEDAKDLATFISNTVYQVQNDRGDFEW